MKNNVLHFLSTVLLGGCAGIILDFIFKTNVICTVLGLIVGLVIAFISKKKQ